MLSPQKYKISNAPLTLSGIALGVLIASYFLFRAVESPETRYFESWYPVAALILAAASVVASFVFVTSERERVREMLADAEQEQQSLARAIEQISSGSYHFTSENGADNRVFQSLRELKTQLDAIGEEESRRNWHVKGLAEFAELLQKQNDTAALSEALITRLCKYLHAEQGALFLVEETEAQADYPDLALAGHYAAAKLDRLKTELERGAGVVGEAVREQKPVYLTDLPQGYVSVASGLGEASPQYLLLCPMLLENKALGVIELASFSPFEIYEIAFAEELGARAAVTYFNLRTSARTTEMLKESQEMARSLRAREQELLKTTEAIQKAQSELESNQNQMNNIMKNLPDAIIQMKETSGGQFGFTFASDRAAELTRLPVPKLLQSPDALRIDPEDEKRFAALRAETAKSGGDLKWEGKALAGQNGRSDYRWFRISATTDLLPGGGVVWDGTLSDITDELEQQEILRLRDRAITSSSSGVTIADMLQPDQPLIYVNPAFTEMTGYPHEEVVGNNCRFLQADDRDQDALNELRAALKEGRECKVLLRNYRKDGTMFWNELNLAPVRDDNGKLTHFIGIQNDVTQRIESEKQIRQMNENLEEKVKERTEALTNTLNELKSAQNRVVQSEKLASLGQLIAGVAHEINTPLAAIKAGAENTSEFLPKALTQLPFILSELEPRDRKLFMKLVESSMTTDQELNTREERLLRKEFEQTLKDEGIAKARDFAKKLVTNGIRGDISEFLPLMKLENANDVIQISYYLAQMKSNLNVIHQAADKTRKTVYALKRYSHFQQEEQMEQFDLHESLEIILTLYHNQLKHGVSVSKDFAPDMPKIMGYSDEIGQVWTNIIHNAAQAMNFNGSLKLETSREADMAVVRITDSGPGIPEHVVKKIFDPFFTTKPQGEGTGLGLDICRKIVEKHEGTINVDTVPGRTTFIIKLPFEHEKEIAPEIAAETAPAPKEAPSAD